MEGLSVGIKVRDGKTQILIPKCQQIL